MQNMQLRLHLENQSFTDFFAGAIFSKVFGTTWPGEGTIYMFQEMSFRAPVFVENDYTAKFEVIEINDEKTQRSNKMYA